MDNNRKKPEVLAPASSLEVLKTAVYYGADAVYIGGEMYGLRARQKTFLRKIWLRESVLLTNTGKKCM